MLIIIILYNIQFFLSIKYDIILKNTESRRFMKKIHYEKHRRLGLKISYYRKLRGYTQEQLSEKIDKNTAFIGAVEAPNVNRTISLDTLFDIADALDIPPYKLLTED